MSFRFVRRGHSVHRLSSRPVENGSYSSARTKRYKSRSRAIVRRQYDVSQVVFPRIRQVCRVQITAWLDSWWASVAASSVAFATVGGFLTLDWPRQPLVFGAGLLINTPLSGQVVGRLATQPCEEFLSRIASLRRWQLLFVLVFAGVLGASPLAIAGVSSPSPVAAPAIEACRIVPNPRVNTSFACGDLNAFPASVNVTVTFQVNVSDSTDNKMSVTFYFDYYNPNSSGGAPPVDTPSPVRTFNVSAPLVGSIVSVNTTWTYERLSNFSTGEYWVNISVRNDVGDFDPSLGSLLFPVMVNQNAAPFIDGLLSLNSVNQPLRYQNPVIPLLYENVSIGDPDADPVTVTWAWGDGTLTVNHPGPLAARLDLSVAHRYPPSQFPLNESPRYVDIPVSGWIDDGLGHNVSYNSTAEFYIAFDSPPSVHVVQLSSATWSPTQAVGSVWKVGERVSMVGNVTDPEGDPTTAYWDFDNRTDSNGDGDPTRDRDANGTTATHAYSTPGNYSIIFWATDGEQKTCLNSNCTNPPPYPPFLTHWKNDTIPIQVINNRPPHVALSNTTVQVEEPSLLGAKVFDYDGDNMTVT